MFVRFSLAILFAVLVASSRPVVRGGGHDLLAVGVRVERGEGGAAKSRLVLSAPTDEALRAYEALLASPARASLLQGSPIYAGSGEVLALEGGRERIAELVFYGVRSRAGRAPVSFTGSAESAPAGSDRARALARSLAVLPDTVTAATARVLLESPDDAAFRDALEALADARPGMASAEALRTALAPPSDAAASTVRRVVAVHVLKQRLGGRQVFPEAFRALAESRDPLVRDAAK